MTNHTSLPLFTQCLRRRVGGAFLPADMSCWGGCHSCGYCFLYPPLNSLTPGVVCVAGAVLYPRLTLPAVTVCPSGPTLTLLAVETTISVGTRRGSPCMQFQRFLAAPLCPGLQDQRFVEVPNFLPGHASPPARRHWSSFGFWGVFTRRTCVGGLFRR